MNAEKVKRFNKLLDKVGSIYETFIKVSPNARDIVFEKLPIEDIFNWYEDMELKDYVMTEMENKTVALSVATGEAKKEIEDYLMKMTLFVGVMIKIARRRRELDEMNVLELAKLLTEMSK